VDIGSRKENASKPQNHRFNEQAPEKHPGLVFSAIAIAGGHAPYVRVRIRIMKLS
jgi:hypothetical protein